MSEYDIDSPSCPVGVDDCHWLEEVARLKQENQSLQQLVTTDTLTGLYNLRFFRDTLNKEMERTIRMGRPTSLIMIDLDHFKTINDNYGHQAGDQALIHAARVFEQAIRLSDVVCRYGGEEFVIILPQTPLPTAVHVAERVRLWLEQSSVELADQGPLNLTASFGVEVFLQSQDDDMEAFVEKVDAYMYQAKQQGRNRVCHAAYAGQHETSVSIDEKSALFGPPDEQD